MDTEIEVYSWPKLNRELIASAAISGLKIANADAQEISGGSWVTDFACEGFVAGCVAKQLFANLANIHFFLEYPPWAIIENSGATPTRGRVPKGILGAKRIDISGYRNDKTVMVGEIKKISSRNLMKKDIERVALCIARGGPRRNGALTHGFFLGYFHKSQGIADDNFLRIQDVLRYLDEIVSELRRKLGLSGSIFHSALRYEWHDSWTLWAVCVVLSYEEFP